MGEQHSIGAEKIALVEGLMAVRRNKGDAGCVLPWFWWLFQQWLCWAWRYEIWAGICGRRLHIPSKR